MNVTFRISTGKMIESQSDTDEATMRQNAINGQIPADDIRFEILTQAQVDELENASKPTVVALSTDATTGFLKIPICFGMPIGIPDMKPDHVCAVYDAKNKKFYIYLDGWQPIN